MSNLSYKSDPFEMNRVVSVKNNRVVFRLTKEDREKLSKTWRERLYPDPKDPTHTINFKSEQEFLEFVIRCVLKQGRNSWFWFSILLNPDYPME